MPQGHGYGPIGTYEYIHPPGVDMAQGHGYGPIGTYEYIHPPCTGYALKGVMAL